MSTQKEILASRKTELPEGWENYSICKDKIPDTPFLAFKVPLSQEIQGRYNEKMKIYMDKRRKTGMKARPIMFTNWTVKEIEKKYSNMDLIIDLTNTTKYYDPAELPNHMKHVKIKSKGGGPVPDSKVVQKFYQVVDETLSKKKGKFLICITQTSGLLFRSSHIFGFWYFGHFSCMIFFPVLFRLAHLALQNLNKDYIIFS